MKAQSTQSLDNAILQDDELEMMLDMVERFTAQQLMPAFARPEQTRSTNELETIYHSVSELGLLEPAYEPGQSSLSEQNEYTLWHSPGAARLSSKVLQIFARANPGLAWWLHQSALAMFISRQIGMAASFKADQIALCLQGHYGLARYSLAHYLAGSADNDDMALLDDYFSTGADRPRLFQAPQNRPLLLASEWQDNHLQFVYYKTQQLHIDTPLNDHGLNECPACLWHSKKRIKPLFRSNLSHEKSRTLIRSVIGMEWLGNLSIGLGTLQNGYQLARDYAALRRQGGKLIKQHPAVQQMLNSGRSTIATARACINAHIATFSIQPSNLQALADLALTRQRLNHDFCTAANQLLQAFGGMGYMRDTGLEKVVRDCNQLRLMMGTPSELGLFAHALEEAR